MDQILNRLEDLYKLIESQGINNKEVLNMNEACKYLELSISHLYKLTSGGMIPFYKPSGKKLYFKKSELDSWLLRNRCATMEEIENDNTNYLKRGRR
jgi:excisionase family DNA binding protein